MRVHHLTPILNVSSVTQSFAWFEKLGWQKAWDWGSPPTFGGVCCDKAEIFLCEGGQGGRGHTGLPMTFGPGSDEAAEKGIWYCRGVTEMGQILFWQPLLLLVVLLLVVTMRDNRSYWRRLANDHAQDGSRVHSRPPPRALA